MKAMIVRIKAYEHRPPAKELLRPLDLKRCFKVKVNDLSVGYFEQNPCDRAVSHPIVEQLHSQR